MPKDRKTHTPAVQRGLSDIILEQAIKKRAFVRIYLTTGLKLEGFVVNFDPYTITITSRFTPDIPQMIYKHVISTIMWDPVEKISVPDHTQSGSAALSID